MKKNVGISYKAFAVILAAVLILGGAIGGTMAWLIDDTDAVANVFTDSDINITLVEEAQEELKTNSDAFKMIPGHTIKKDPKVTVKAGSEDCYLFVKIDKSTNYDDYLAPYAVDTTSESGWEKLTNSAGEPIEGVYYRIVKTTDETREFSILASGSYISKEDGEFTWTDDHVLVKPEVTKADMKEIQDNPKNSPTLTFTAYAVQLYKTNVGEDTAREFTPAEAWKKANNL